jgi:uncharacterized membrane protein
MKRLLLAFLLAGACSSEPTAPSVDCTAVTVPTYGEMTLWPLCTSCHSSTRTGSAREKAPEGINYDTYLAARGQASAAAAQVSAGLMPPRNESQMSEDQKAALYAWAACGTPQ